MDKELFTSLADYLKSAELLGTTALVVAVGYSIWRTGSLHLIRRRLWGILYGKEEIDDEEIRQFVSGRSSLMAFRFTAGVPARTLDHAKRMVAWAADNDEDIHAIAVAGPHFDREKLQLKTPLPRKGWRLAATCILGGTGTLVFLLGAPSWMTRGYFQIRATGLWFSTNGQEVREAGPSLLRASFPWVGMPGASQPLTLEMCKSTKIPADAFGKDQSEVLCQFLTAKDKDKQISDDLQLQQRGAEVLLALFLYYLGMAVVGLYRLEAAWRMQARLQERPRQLSLPFD